MARKKHVYEYPRPAVTVDIALVTESRQPKVLLIRRKHPPFVGAWALPGGFVDAGETLEQAARRELLEETNLEIAELTQLQTFGDPGRDPRGWTISVVFLARVKKATLKPKAGDDAAEAGWFSLNKPPELAFDHAKILEEVKCQLKRWLVPKVGVEPTRP